MFLRSSPGLARSDLLLLDKADPFSFAYQLGCNAKYQFITDNSLSSKFFCIVPLISTASYLHKSIRPAPTNNNPCAGAVQEINPRSFFRTSSTRKLSFSSFLNCLLILLPFLGDKTHGSLHQAMDYPA
jgi:hypothetical protein